MTRSLETRRTPVLAATWLLLALSATAPGRSQTDPRPTVRVSFEADEPDVNASVDVEALADKVVEQMVTLLDREIRFLRFTGAGAADVELLLELGSEDAPAVVHPLYLHASVSGRVTGEPEPFPILVVDLLTAATDPPETAEGLARAIFDGARAVDDQAWVHRLFRRVIVAESAHPFRDPAGSYWALPFRLDEVRAETKTAFLIDSELTVFDNARQLKSKAEACGHVGRDNEGVPEAFREKAMAQILDPQEAELLSQASAHRPRTVQVTSYVRSFDEDDEPTSGTDVDPAGGGTTDGDPP